MGECRGGGLSGWSAKTGWGAVDDLVIFVCITSRPQAGAGGANWPHICRKNMRSTAACLQTVKLVSGVLLCYVFLILLLLCCPLPVMSHCGGVSEAHLAMLKRTTRSHSYQGILPSWGVGVFPSIRLSVVVFIRPPCRMPHVFRPTARFVNSTVLSLEAQSIVKAAVARRAMGAVVKRARPQL